MDYEQIIYIVTYFFIYSFFGWVLESVAKTISQKKLVNSGFLYGPFCPIYGIGAVRNGTNTKIFSGTLYCYIHCQLFYIFCMGIFCWLAIRKII